MNDLNNDTDDPHRGTEELLPWYVTGQLDRADRELVERHLSGCTRCELELRLERRLAKRWRAIAPGVELGWQRLRARLEPPPARRPAKPGAPAPSVRSAQSPR